MNIGLFYDNWHKARNGAEADARQTLFAVFDQFRMRVMVGDVVYHYITIISPDDVHKISGMEFDDIFIKGNFPPEVNAHIKSRYKRNKGE